MPAAVAIPVAGGVSGALAWLISFPLDCIKANIQGQRIEAAAAAPRRVTAASAAQAIFRAKGVLGLYSGVGPSIARAFLVSGSRFSACVPPPAHRRRCDAVEPLFDTALECGGVDDSQLRDDGVAHTSGRRRRRELAHGTRDVTANPCDWARQPRSEHLQYELRRAAERRGERCGRNAELRE